VLGRGGGLSSRMSRVSTARVEAEAKPVGWPSALVEEEDPGAFRPAMRALKTSRSRTVGACGDLRALEV